MTPTKKVEKAGPEAVAAPLVLACEQGSAEWKALRSGRVTASHICDVMSYLKNGSEAKARRDYRIQLVTETLTGEPCDDIYETADMRWGIEQEPFARIIYEQTRRVQVQQVGFVLHSSIEQAGASPDGLVGSDGLVEIKCPRSYNHINNILGGTVANPDYQLQMLWQMECMNRQWCDFISFDPRMPEHLKLFVVRFNRDEEAIKKIKDEVIKFLAEVNTLVSELAAIK